MRTWATTQHSLDAYCRPPGPRMHQACTAPATGCSRSVSQTTAPDHLRQSSHEAQPGRLLQAPRASRAPCIYSPRNQLGLSLQQLCNCGRQRAGRAVHVAPYGCGKGSHARLHGRLGCLTWSQLRSVHRCREGLCVLLEPECKETCFKSWTQAAFRRATCKLAAHLRAWCCRRPRPAAGPQPWSGLQERQAAAALAGG